MTMQDGMVLVEVAVDAPLRHPLTYLLPAELKGSAAVGCRVIVPLGRREATGYVVGFPEKTDQKPAGLKPVLSVLDPVPLLSSTLLQLCRWSARYYFTPLAEVIRTALPPGINLSFRKVVTLTPAGEELAGKIIREEIPPASTGLSPRQVSALLALTRREKTSGQGEESSAARLSGVTLRRLKELGLVEERRVRKPPRVQEKKERGFRLDHVPGEEELAALSRSKKKLLFVEELKNREWVACSELMNKFSHPGALARPLIKRGLVKEVHRPVRREPFSLNLSVGPPPEMLMPEQAAAVAQITEAVEAGQFQVFLLQGVTGSGKTEVYLRAFEKARVGGKSALLLAPEISLTPQLLARFRQRFPASELAVLHSGLSPGERRDEWERIRQGTARIVIGARSAVFAPLSDLGVIVVDEEQDPAYKQDHGFMYQARDVAVMRGREEKAVVLLGSATPSLESVFHSRKENGYTLLRLPHRVDRRPLPQPLLVDLRQLNLTQPLAGEKKPVPDHYLLPPDELLSPPLAEALDQTISRGEQAILFLNRRGLASLALCLDCGEKFICPNCSVPRSYHRALSDQRMDPFYDRLSRPPGSAGYLLCHYCGAWESLPEVCPRCRGVRVRAFGLGTEQVEESLCQRFPQARILRMDSDVMTKKEDYDRAMDRLLRREVDLLVGTQMVAKGHDLPGVTLVGVLLADLSLNQPDFRAGERTFQILTQVAGRAGRGNRPGSVIVQTFSPDHYSIRAALAQDFEGFYEEELKRRRELFYPPFARLANLRFSSVNPAAVREAARQAAAVARRKLQSKTFRDRVKILGPAAAPLFKIRGKTRWMMIIKADSASTMTAFLSALLQTLDSQKLPSSVHLELDRDPLSLL